MQSVTPECTHSGLGSSAFARRYLRNRVFFLFLRVLRCFSSPGSLPYVMDWRMDTWGLLMWVSPFRHLRINGYLLLPEAYRSLSRLSSALSAKASALRPSSLDLSLHHPSVGDAVVWFSLFLITLLSMSSYLAFYEILSYLLTFCIKDIWLTLIKFHVCSFQGTYWLNFYQSLEILNSFKISNHW